MQKIIDTEKSDLFDVLAHVAYALPPVFRAREPITLDELRSVRRRLRGELGSALTANHRQFLLSLVAGAPDWHLINCAHLVELPAIRWKLQNLARLKKANPAKFAQQTDELRVRFGS